MDIEERMDDDTMEYEEAPSADMPIETDGIAREDEVMATDATLASDPNPIPIEADADVDLDAEYDDGDGMEPEPTPLPAADGAGVDPFFATPSAGVLGGAEVAQNLASETPAAGGVGTADVAPVTSAPLGTEGAVGVARATEGGGAPVPSPSVTRPVASSSTSQPDHTSEPLPVEADIAEAEVYYEESGEGAEGEEEEYYYEEDEPEAGPSTTIKATIPISFEDDDEDESDESEEWDLGYDPDVTVTIDTLPTVLLHLPDRIVSIFHPPHPAHRLPAAIVPTATPVWFIGQHAQLAQLPMRDFITVLRAALITAGHGPAMEGKEVTLHEHGLNLKLCEHDENVTKITLLEYIQVHHQCALPNTIEFHVTFEESRFWDRFKAIKTELASTIEHEKNVKQQAEVRAAAATDAAAAEVEGQGEDNVENGEGAESARPQTDWAKTLATAPLAYGIGAVGSSSRSRPEATNNDAPIASGSDDKGRSSSKNDEETTDTADPSMTDSNPTKQPLDKLALIDAGLHPTMSKSDLRGGDEVDTGAVGGVVGKDEIELKHEREAAEEGLGADAVGEEGVSAPIDKTDSTIEGLSTEAAVTTTPLAAEPSAGEAAASASANAPGADAGTQPFIGSSLANEVLPENTEVEGDEEYEEEEEVYEVYEGDEGDEGEGVDGGEEAADEAEEVGGDEYEVSNEKIVQDAADQQEEDGEEQKTALQLAAEGDVISKAAVEAVDGPDWPEGYEDDTYDDTGDAEDPINPFSKPVEGEGEVSPTTSTTIDDDDEEHEEYYEGDDVDEGYHEGEADDASLMSSKRPAEVDEEEATASVKRPRVPVQASESATS